MNETPKELDAAVKLILDYKPPPKDTDEQSGGAVQCTPSSSCE